VFAASTTKKPRLLAGFVNEMMAQSIDFYGEQTSI
jgi:hypothetical protein